MGYPRVPQRHNKQIAFLASLAKGKTPFEAAQIVGVPWPTFYTWRRKHTRFRKAWDEARAYAATPDFPSPAKLAKLEIVPHDQPVEIEYRDLAARELLIHVHNVQLDPLPDNYVVTEIPSRAVPEVKAWLDSLTDPEQREIERRRWQRLPE